ncbi:alpha/beta fold hydrolase [Candidatus Margulisiibacteriota bacterium]
MKIVYLHGWAFAPNIWQKINYGLPDCITIDSSGVKIRAKESYSGNASLVKDRSCVCSSECGTGKHSVYCPDLYILKPPFTFKNMARQLYDELKSSNEDILLVGWSMGGSIALDLCRYDDLPIKGLVLISSTAKFMNEDDYEHGMSPIICRGLRRRLIYNKEETLRFFRTLLFPQDKWGSPAYCPEHRYSFAGITGHTRIPQESLLETLDELYHTDYRDMLDSIKAPVLIIHGCDDQICPVQSGEYLHSNISGSQIAVIEDAGHMPFITQTEKFKELLTGFISKIGVEEDHAVVVK